MLKDILYLSFRYVRKQGIRSFLTMIQIMLGIAAITLIFHMILGIFQGIDDLERDMGGGIYLLNVVTEVPQAFQDGIHYRHHQILSSTDLDRISQIHTVEHLSPADSIWQPLLRFNDNFFRLRKMSYVGPEFPRIAGLSIIHGYFFTSEDYQQKAPVALISRNAASLIFPDASPIGKEIEVYMYWHGEELPHPSIYTIIGVFEAANTQEYSPLSGDQILVPATLKIGNRPTIISTQEGELPLEFIQRITMEETLIFDTIVLQIQEGSYSETLTAINRQIKDTFGEDYQVQLRSYNRFVEDFRDWARFLSLILSGFGFLLVIISSTGIISTMMVSILERTTQIGLEKAMGAPKWFIFLRFTFESLFISLGGGLLGSLLAYLLTDSINQLGRYLPINLEGGLYKEAVLLGLFVALLSGSLFSIYPAIQAVKMEPVEALTHR